MLADINQSVKNQHEVKSSRNDIFTMASKETGFDIQSQERNLQIHDSM